jgi:hypothetical protein
LWVYGFEGGLVKFGAVWGWFGQLWDALCTIWNGYRQITTSLLLFTTKTTKKKKSFSHRFHWFTRVRALPRSSRRPRRKRKLTTDLHGWARI